MSEKNVASREEKLLSPTNGFTVLILLLLLLAVATATFVLSAISLDNEFSGSALAVLLVSVLVWCVCPIFFIGLKAINPNESAVYVLFGKYYGTISKAGFYFINPFCVEINPTVGTYGSIATITGTVSAAAAKGKRVSMKASTLNNDKQKINDREGNPIDIGVVVIWRVVNATKAVFEVDNYKSYISIQCDAAIRQVARQYPYDISEEGDEKSLRGSSNEVASELKKELQERVEIAGLEIIETRIAHLAYAQEIAAAMLQRQQADAVIAARQKIVEGAVGMVEMALNKLDENGTVKLDEERKAAMVSNLLVVLCGNKDAQPIVNSGSIY